MHSLCGARVARPPGWSPSRGSAPPHQRPLRPGRRASWPKRALPEGAARGRCAPGCSPRRTERASRPKGPGRCPPGWSPSWGSAPPHHRPLRPGRRASWPKRALPEGAARGRCAPGSTRPPGRESQDPAHLVVRDLHVPHLRVPAVLNEDTVARLGTTPFSHASWPHVGPDPWIPALRPRWPRLLRRAN